MHQAGRAGAGRGRASTFGNRTVSTGDSWLCGPASRRVCAFGCSRCRAPPAVPSATRVRRIGGELRATAGTSRNSALRKRLGKSHATGSALDRAASRQESWHLPGAPSVSTGADDVGGGARADNARHPRVRLVGQRLHDQSAGALAGIARGRGSDEREGAERDVMRFRSSRNTTWGSKPSSSASSYSA